MARGSEPVVLELASLPREQMGPFLLLGLDKSADRGAVDRHWADRLKWARRSLIKVPLEDVNWAREELSEPARRVKADTCSLNADTTDRILGNLSQRFGVQGGQAKRGWQPLDSEKALADYHLPAEVPDRQAVCQAITVPALPDDLPAVPSLLRQLANQSLDPWGVSLSPIAD
jgi:hypothetical protein